jgi:hypothetical protein
MRSFPKLETQVQFLLEAPMKKYITIIDPKGATYGYGGPLVPVSHCVLLDTNVFHGFESIRKLFPDHQSMVDFLVSCASHPLGTNGVSETGLRWTLTTTPTSTWTYGDGGTWVDILTKSNDTVLNAGVA